MLQLQFLEPFFFDCLINHSNFWFIHLFMSSAMDVLLSTASIMNLCLISLDRYWSITKAVEYLKTRTPTRALVMIAAVWMMSALICIPPLLGWGVKRSEDSLPQCEVSCTNLFIFGIYYGAGHWIKSTRKIFSFNVDQFMKKLIEENTFENLQSIDWKEFLWDIRDPSGQHWTYYQLKFCTKNYYLCGWLCNRTFSTIIQSIDFYRVKKTILNFSHASTKYKM